MEIINIKENDTNTIIYIENKEYYGYKFQNNDVKKNDIHILDDFKMFKLSKNYTKLKKYQRYEVYLDNNTGLKHYFYNNTENFYLFYLNNGYDCISYSGKSSNHNLNNKKIFRLNNKIIICTFLGLMLAIGNINQLEQKSINSINDLFNDYKTSDIKTMINSSLSLTKEEKEFLYNESFINDVLEIVNDSYYEKNKLRECFNNINIVSYNDIEHETKAGYYRTDTPNTLYIKNYTQIDDQKKATLAHEFAHLCQTVGSYNLIIEASADIITKEYFYKDYKFAYTIQVKLLKKLMEIIGSYPIWYYNFTGDFSKIDERVSPYLTDEEYTKLLKDLTFDYDNKEINEPKYKELDELLNTLYYRIYEKDIKEDEIISLVENEDPNLVRYYFNQQMINEENSFYQDYGLGTYETISYKEAIDIGVITAYTISYIEISHEEAFKIIEDDTYYLRRDIDYHSHNISLHYSKYESKKVTISGIIDGIAYEDANLDDLVKDGIIEVTYYIIDRKNLTGTDYENHNYCDDELYITPTKYVTINENSIDNLVPKKIYLPKIDTRYNFATKNKHIKSKRITHD